MAVRRVWKDKREERMQGWAQSQWAQHGHSLPRVCHICKRRGPIQAHHPSYYRPMSVVPLCASCHQKITHWYAVTSNPQPRIALKNISVCARAHRSLKIHCVDTGTKVQDVAAIAITAYLRTWGK